MMMLRRFGASAAKAVLPVLLALQAAGLTALYAPVRLLRGGRRPRQPKAGSPRVLVAFTRGHLEPTVLDAAIRIARAEEAALVPAYLILIPMQFPLEAPMSQECATAIPLLEAVEHAAARAGVPVDARIERLWNVEHFDRIVIPAPAGREPGCTPKELLWMLTHAPNETLILRPDPALQAAHEQAADDRAGLASTRRNATLTRGAAAEAAAARVPARQTR